MDRFFHSVTLDKEKCVGCTNCIKRCPTQAIRVRGGKAQIISERCIDCGECIRVCPHHAKKAGHDPFEMLKDFTYTVALPAPTLYGQFNHLDDIDIVLTGLKAIGFDDVFEVSRGAEIHSDLTRQLLGDGKLKKPAISSACPAVVRLIRVRFPDLCDHVLPLKAPMEIAALLAREEAIKKTGLPSEQIGIFFLSPCAAKVTDVRVPIGIPHSNVDGVLSISDLYPRLVSAMNHLDKVEPLARSGIIGVSWSSIGGEAAGLLNENHLAADGIENVIQVLEELEDEKLQELDFIELNACAGGCVGGIFAAENGYVARARIQRLRKYLPVSCNRTEDAGCAERLEWTDRLEFAPGHEAGRERGGRHATDGTHRRHQRAAAPAGLRLLRRADLPGPGGGRRAGAGQGDRLHLPHAQADTGHRRPIKPAGGLRAPLRGLRRKDNDC